MHKLKMSTAGNIFGIVFGCILAVVFVSLFIYSAYKAYVDRKRIIEKNRRIQEDDLLSEERGDEDGEQDADQFSDEPPMMERKWTQKGVAYRREGAVVHISVKDKNQQKDEDCVLPKQQVTTYSTMQQPNGARPAQNNVEVEINGDPPAPIVPTSANVISAGNGHDEANASWL
ncbi:uncharacterized protein [Antedon mediterranea]|uniref:uncharacterized protein n=1 Tax=Antedon mediterranea TaxID=105859 RepID=UPI003AF8EDD8